MSSIDAADARAEVGICVCRVERQNRGPSERCALYIPSSVMTNDKAIEAPVLPGNADPTKERERIPTACESRTANSKLLTSKLHYAAVIESLAVKPAVEIRVLIPGRDVNTRVWIGVLHAPAPHVDAQLAGSPLDAQMLE